MDIVNLLNNNDIQLTELSNVAFPPNMTAEENVLVDNELTEGQIHMLRCNMNSEENGPTQNVRRQYEDVHQLLTEWGLVDLYALLEGKKVRFFAANY